MFKKLTGLTAVAGLFIAGTASADIANSVHDFRTELSTTDLCAVCHTTHDDTSGIAEAPLWDHTVTTTQYVPYTSPTMDSITSPTAVSPSGISALCLSCHDGTIAVDAYGGNPGGTAGNEIGTLFPGVGSGMLDADMSSEHPISMSYDAADAAGFQTDPLDGIPLFGRNVECASCHDVHNQVGANAALLINTNDGSAICLDCHIK